MITKILVALDGSARAPHVFDVAVDIATHYGASLIPFRAIAIPPEFPPGAHIHGADALPTYLRNQALSAFGDLAARATGVKLESPVVSEKEPAWKAILDAAKEHNVDLIVLGSHGYHGFDHLLGTTAGKVANLATWNVFVVHDHDAA